MMKIGIDVRYLSHGLVGGVHTYIKHFVPAVIDLAHEHQVFLYADTKRPFELDVKALPDNVVMRLLPYRNALYSAYHDFFMRQQMAKDQLDIAHFPANYGFGPSNARTVITLHDSLTILPLSVVLRGKGTPRKPRVVAMTLYLHALSTMSLRHAALLVTDSEHARTDIARQSGFDVHKIVAVPLAPTPDMRRIEDPTTLSDVRQRHHLPQSFVLADALKNPAVLVRAWRLLPEELRKDRRVVFFSRRPDPLPVVHQAVAADEARLLIRPSREDLIALYSMADVFVFPSWFEGFGIPVLEAMVCGAPVIASDRYSIPEVAGGVALIADAEDEATFAKHLTRVLSLPQEAQRLRQLGFARASQFSWQNTAQGILESYERTMRLCA